MGVTLARRTLGPAALSVFAVGASSPLTVLVGGIVSTYALTGVVGVPLSFVVIMAALGVLVVGYVAVSRHVPHGGPFYAQLARGVNPAVGIGAGVVALLGYNAIQISLYPLIGTTLAGLFGGTWWVWAAGALLVVAVLGRFRGASNARVLGWLLAVEIACILLFDVAGFANPAGGAISWAPLAPSSLLVSGVSGAVAFAMAAFVGADTVPAFGEEARSAAAVRAATYGGIVFLGVLYTVSAWAYATITGPARVNAAALDPEQNPLAILGRVFGPGLQTLVTVLLVTSVLAALSAFHATCARYTFAMARERVLPAGLAGVTGGVSGGAPIAGSVLQSGIAAIVLAAFVIGGAQPMTTMFVWLSTLGAVSVLVLLTASSYGAWSFFNAGRGTRESVAERALLPAVGVVIGLLVLVFMVSNLSSLLGTPPDSRWPLLVPGLTSTAAVVGLAWGAILRRRQRDVYEQVGLGAPDPLTVRDQRLAELEV